MGYRGIYITRSPNMVTFRCIFIQNYIVLHEKFVWLLRVSWRMVWFTISKGIILVTSPLTGTMNIVLMGSHSKIIFRNSLLFYYSLNIYNILPNFVFVKFNTVFYTGNKDIVFVKTDVHWTFGNNAKIWSCTITGKHSG